MKKSTILTTTGILLVAGFFLCRPVTEQASDSPVSPSHAVKHLDLSAYSAVPHWRDLDLLFIHHSCGGQLLAAPGPAVGENSIHPTHPNGGNLRTLLQKSGYLVHEAAYGCRIGENTDLFDWPPKFREQMNDILHCDLQDQPLPAPRRNRIVVFKSCFPNNIFRGEGHPPGNPAGPELTVWNARAAFAALLPEFAKQPDTLFVCLTAPPLAPQKPPVPLWRWLARKLKGSDYNLDESGRLARKDYPGKNIVVFDYYDLLTGFGRSNLSVYPTEQGMDSHPSQEGNNRAAQAFVPFLNQAVHRAQSTSSAP